MKDEALALKLKIMRQRRGLTQKELSEHIGIGRQCISSYETGRSTPPPENLMIFADFYGISVDSLLDKAVPAPPQIDARDLTKKQIEALNIVVEEFRRLNRRNPSYTV